MDLKIDYNNVFDVQIIKSSSITDWYNGLENEIFTVTNYGEDYYVVIEQDWSFRTNCIRKTDAVLLNSE